MLLAVIMERLKNQKFRCLHLRNMGKKEAIKLEEVMTIAKSAILIELFVKVVRSVIQRRVTPSMFEEIELSLRILRAKG